MPGAAAHASFSFLKALNGEPLADEYDPSKPNDFEDIMKQRERRKREAEEEAERAARIREAEQVSLALQPVLLSCSWFGVCSTPTADVFSAWMLCAPGS